MSHATAPLFLFKNEEGEFQYEVFREEQRPEDVLSLLGVIRHIEQKQIKNHVLRYGLWHQDQIFLLFIIQWELVRSYFECPVNCFKINI